MKNFKKFLSTKGFYIALCTGVIAFAALMVAYDYNSTDERLGNEQAIDLNEPVDNEEVAGRTDATTQDDLSQIVNSQGALVKEDVKEEVVKEQITTEIIQEGTTKQEEVQEELQDVSSHSAQPEKQEIVFDEERSLIWPLIGNVILPYSMDTTVYFQTLDTYKCNPAILIQGEEGSDVFAACRGIVVDIVETKELGTVVIMDLGSGYEATYGQLMNVTVYPGQLVAESQNIGEVAPVSTHYIEEGNHLYFKITKDGEPVDPMTLIR